MNTKKEIKGIYNTTFNNKNATPIKTQFQKDLEVIENAVIESVVMYVKGYHSWRNDRGLGAEHIKLHLQPQSKGYIKVEELLNLGKHIRKYMHQFQEPFIDEKGAKIYEWENNKNVRFRVVVDKIRREGDNCLSTSPDEIIITFYSDRNLNKKMEFKNPEVTAFYMQVSQSLDREKTFSSTNDATRNTPSKQTKDVSNHSGVSKKKKSKDFERGI